MQGICHILVDRMKIVTMYKRLTEDTKGHHIEVSTVYTGSKEDIDTLEEKMRESIGDIQIVEVSDGSMGN